MLCFALSLKELDGRQIKVSKANSRSSGGGRGGGYQSRGRRGFGGRGGSSFGGGRGYGGGGRF